LVPNIAEVARFRIDKLSAANTAPTSVRPDATLQHAVTIMMANDFSQLPVMTSEREVKGIVSWWSIGSRMVVGRSGLFVREVMDKHQEIDAESSLFEAIPIIERHQYVLVRGSDNKIAGIVTATDLSLQFRQLAEPFLLIGEIENHVRRLLGSTFTQEELAAVRDPEDGEREIETVADLSFGEYLRLLEEESRWQKANIPVDRAVFCKELDKVRKIRNDVMHFDPDPLPQDQVEHLRNITNFLQRLQTLGIP
jgi:predicted transcriptional regulator